MTKIKYPKLRAARVEKGYTAKDVAEYLKTGFDNYLKKERGEVVLTVDEALSLMSLFNKKFEDLFTAS